MDSNVNIDRITADLEKKFNGEPNHDVQVIQEYCRTLPPCEESAKLVAALGKYAAEKFPDAEAFKFAKMIDEILRELEKDFTDDPNHNIEVIQNYCKNLPKNEQNFKISMALGQYAAARFPEADEVKKSRAEFEKVNEEANKIKARIEAIQETIKAGEVEKAIEGLKSVISDMQLPKDDTKRFVSFTQPFEEILFQATVKETRPVVRISNMLEMLNLQLGGLLAETGKFDEARAAIAQSLEYNPISAPAHLERARISMVEKKYEEAFTLLKEAYPLLFSRQMLAVFYCLLADVVEKLDKNYPLAVAYCYVSMDYANNEPAQDLLKRIAEAHNVDSSKPKVDAVRKLASDAGLPLGPNPDLIRLAVDAAQKTRSSYPEVSKQFFTIAYELTGNKEFLKEIK